MTDQPTGWNGQGSTSAWRRYRSAILEANRRATGGECQLKLAGCEHQATEVHHSKPWTGRPENIDPTEATPCCKPCNNRAGWTPDTTDPQPRPWT